MGGNFARFFLLVKTNTRAVVAMAEVTSKRGRCYINGKPLQLDLRRKIVEDIVEDGGDFVTGFFPGNFSAIAERNRVKFDTVQKIWKEVVEKGDTRITKTRAAGVKQIQQDDIDFIRFLKTERASMTAGELYKHTNEHCNIAAGTSKTAIRRVLRNIMTDGKWTWKKITRPV